MLELQDQLLATKFFIPVTTRSAITRIRLIDRLNEGRDRKLTLVSAPAGFGKTTLLSEWLRSLKELPESERPLTAWISLDSEDNDNMRFWQYFFSALDQALPGFCEPFLSYLQKEQTPAFQTLLTTFINTLANQRESFFLVLDDYHVITEPEVHSLIIYLIEHLSSQLHIVLVSRSTPPLPLARWRGYGQMQEIRTEQLRCTSTEIQQFFTEAMGLSLSRNEVKTVESRTEGWLVGLQLAALSMRGRSNFTELLREVSGNQHFILDYLTDEVLGQQKADIQDFLLRTSILERLHGSLCDAVLESTNSQEILEYLEQSNLFVVPLDGRREWYRYHALFAEALHSRLLHNFSDEDVRALHLRASHWYARSGQVTEAVSHAFSAQDWAWAADLIEQGPFTLTLAVKEHALLRHWLAQIPEHIVRSRSQLCLAYAQSLYMVGSYKMMEGFLEDADCALQHEMAAASEKKPLSRLQKNGFSKLAGKIATYRAMVSAYYGGDGPKALAYCQDALSHSSALDLSSQAEIHYAESISHYSLGAVVPAYAAVHNALSMAVKAGNTSSIVNYLGRMCFTLLASGRLREVEHAAQQAIRAGTAGGLSQPILCWAYIFYADALRLQHRLDSAYEMVTQAINLSEQTETIISLYLAYIALARIHQARGEAEAAQIAFQQSEIALQKTYSHYRCNAYIIDDWVQYWLNSGDVERAVRWMQAELRQEKLISPLAEQRKETAFIRILLEQHQLSGLIERLDAVIAQTRDDERMYHLIELLVLKAKAYALLSQQGAALETLSEALQLAQPEGHVREFVDEGPVLENMLVQLRRQVKTADLVAYLDTILAAFPTAHEPATQKQERSETGPAREVVTQPLIQPLLDPLSARELEVLELLTQGASNQEIAHHLTVTIHTVKRHVSNIFAKMDVTNRTQAVARSRELGFFNRNEHSGEKTQFHA